MQQLKHTLIQQLLIGIGGYVPTSRTISTTNGITGGGDLTANRTLSLDSTVVRTTGNQTIGGTKTFSESCCSSNQTRLAGQLRLTLFRNSVATFLISSITRNIIL